jgi:endo-1,4-beta-xylanase
MANLRSRSCSRRKFLRAGAAAVLGGALAGCRRSADLPPTEVAADPRSLRSLADLLGIHWGTTTGWLFQAEDLKLRARFRGILEREFNQTTIGWGLCWSEIEPREAEITFVIPDTQFEYAEKVGMALCGHPLVFSTAPASLPDWLLRSRLSRPQLIRRFEEHIHRVVRRYRGRVKDWVVVNEPLCPPYRSRDFFAEKIGPEYIPIAFAAARAADPDARLIYNDTDNHTPTGLTHGLTMQHLKTLRARNLVDVVGLQMHLDGRNPPSREALLDAIRGYELPVHVTELDINMKGTGSDRKQQFETQARIFSGVVEACLDGGVKRITVWEIGDRYSWLVVRTPGSSDISPDAAPTLFDDHLEPKPGYQAVKNAFLARLTS